MFIFLERDSFSAKSRATGSKVREDQSFREAGFGEKAPIRRPYRGIQIKEDTFAVLSVRHADGTAIPLTSSSKVGYKQGGGSTGQVDDYSDFILQQVQDQRVERQQIIETFGDTFVYFFGERPRVVTLSGQLINTEDFNWRAQFWHNYDKFLRGSKLVEFNARCYLAYDSIVLEGYPISAAASDDADNPYQVQFTMSVLLTDYHEYSMIGEMRFPGVQQGDYEVLNRELEKTRSRFVSTTLDVRKYNLNGSLNTQLPRSAGALELLSDKFPGTKSALGYLRSGVKELQAASSWLGDKVAIANRLVGGRALRVPIGAAGFLSMMAEGEVGPFTASVVTSADRSLDAASGRVNGSITVNGHKIFGNKILMMGPSKFAPSWKSAVTGSSRGLIYENYDEYPLQERNSILTDKSQKTALDYLSSADKQKVMDRTALRTSNMTEFQKSLVQYNIYAAQGGFLGELATIVEASRIGYGMVLTAASVARDPLLAATSTLLGLTPKGIESMGKGLGASALIPGLSGFIGLGKAWEDAFKTGQPTAKIGDVYATSSYKSTLSTKPDDKNYELAYGKSDYSALIASQSTLDAERLALEGDLPPGVERSEPNAGKIKDVLDNVYGNADNLSVNSSSEEAVSVAEAYSSGTTTSVNTQSEAAVSVAEAYSTATSATFNSQSEVPVSVGTAYTSSGSSTINSQSEPPSPLSEVYGTAGTVGLSSQNQTPVSIESLYSGIGSSVVNANSEDPATLDEVYGQSGTIVKTTPTPEEMVKLLQAVYGEQALNDVDISGITAEDADSAPIDPVV